MSFEKDHKEEIKILFDMLKEHVKEKYDLEVNTLDDVKIESRKKPLVYFRKTLMVILGETFNKSYNQDEIASVVGLDRTSFIYHSKTHLNDYTRYNDYKQEYDILRNTFLEKIGHDSEK
jgi:hypothetical protein